MKIIRTKTYKHMCGEITRLNNAVVTLTRNNEAMRSGYEKQLKEKDNLIAKLTARCSELEYLVDKGIQPQ